jgi:hypothetical protein
MARLCVEMGRSSLEVPQEGHCRHYHHHCQRPAIARHVRYHTHPALLRTPHLHRTKAGPTPSACLLHLGQTDPKVSSAPDAMILVLEGWALAQERALA